VDLVDEEHIVLLEVRQDCSEVASALDGWAGCDAHRDSHLGGNDVRERRLPKPGRAVEEQVVERFVALLGGVDSDAEVVLELLLADEFIKPPGPQRDVDLLVVVPQLAGDNPLLSRRSPALLRMLVLLLAIIAGHACPVYAAFASAPTSFTSATARPSVSSRSLSVRPSG